VHFRKCKRVGGKSLEDLPLHSKNKKVIMKNNKVLNRIYELFLFFFVAITLAGCRGGGGGGGLFGSSGGGGSLGSNLSGGGGDLGGVANPEPSTLLLLTSGLIGMAVYAKVRLKSKTKK
jgi:hypothetical protein